MISMKIKELLKVLDDNQNVNIYVDNKPRIIGFEPSDDFGEVEECEIKSIYSDRRNYITINIQ